MVLRPAAIAVHPLLTALFEALDVANVRWCLLDREADLLAPAGRICLLMNSADLQPARAVLRKLRFAPDATRDEDPWSNLLSYHEPTDRWIRVAIPVEP